MATELLLYFMCCYNASREASNTAAYSLLHSALYTHDISVTYFLSCEIPNLAFKASMPKRELQTLHNKHFGSTMLDLPKDGNNMTSSVIITVSPV